MLDALHHPRFTYGDYRLWQGDERWELIDGEAFLMSPAPSTRHQAMIFELGGQIRDHLRQRPGCQALASPIDVRLPRRGEADDLVDTVVQPDLVVVCDRRKIDDKGIRGAPDWVIEILSPSTSSRDRVLKRDLYQRHGVHEYWLIDPVGNVLHVYRLEGDRFGKPLIFTEGPVECLALPGFVLDWDSLFAP